MILKNSSCYSSYLKVLEAQEKYKKILQVQQEMNASRETCPFDNQSIGILLNTSIETKSAENVQNLYQLCRNRICMESKQVTWRSLEDCLKAYSILGNIEKCEEIYDYYKTIRIKASSEYNAKYNLKRPRSNDKSLGFSRLYMLPEPPRYILHLMAYVYAYHRQVDKIKKFFEEDVFDADRLELYRFRKSFGQSVEITKSIERARTKIANIKSNKQVADIKKYKTEISKGNKVLKQLDSTITSGLDGPLSIVYSGLKQGWEKGLENLGSEQLGSFYVQMDELILELVKTEDLKVQK